MSLRLSRLWALCCAPIPHPSHFHSALCKASRSGLPSNRRRRSASVAGRSSSQLQEFTFQTQFYWGERSPFHSFPHQWSRFGFLDSVGTPNLTSRSKDLPLRSLRSSELAFQHGEGRGSSILTPDWGTMDSWWFLGKSESAFSKGMVPNT